MVSSLKGESDMMDPTMLTPKQFGDACEYHVIAQLMFSGVPATKQPDGWPVADIIAQPIGRAP